MREQYSVIPRMYGLILVVATVAWIGGILLDSLVHLPPLASLLGAGAAFIFLLLLRHDQQGRFVMLLMLCFLLGTWRYEITSPESDPQTISNFISNDVVNIRGTVVDEPRVEGRSRVLIVAGSDLSRDSGKTWHPVHGQLEARLLGVLIEDPYGANYGDSVQLRGRLQPPSAYSPRNVFASMAFPRISVSDAAAGSFIIAGLYHFRILLATIIARALPQPEAALLIAIVLSLRTPALKPLLPAFNATGVAHLIAPSGFKVTLLAGLVMNTARRLSRKERPGEWLLPAQKRGGWQQWAITALTVTIIVLYTLLSGAVPAAIRAGIMGILLVLAPRLGRAYNVYAGLALAVLCMSGVDPLVLWDAGFLLSTLGTLGIVLLTPFFQRLLTPLARLPFGHTVAEIVAVTLAAQVTTLPVFTLAFNQISFIAPITNILTVPLLEAFLVLGVCVCAVGLLFAPLAILGGWVVEPLLLYVKYIVTWCFTLPGAYITMNSIPAGLAWGYYALLALVSYVVSRVWPAHHAKKQLSPSTQVLPGHVWHRIQLGVALLFMAATGVSVLLLQSGGQLSITFLAVGPAGQSPQGDAILIRTPDGKTLLIDGGRDAVSLSQALDSHLPSWQRSLDAVVLTSTLSDSLTGLQDVVNRYEIGEVIDGGMLHPSTGYALWRRVINERHLHYVRATQGMNIAVGAQVVLQILWPHTNLFKGKDEQRSNALALRLVAPGARVLFLGEVAHSQYALQGLMSEMNSNSLHAEIVHIVGESTTGFPAELNAMLRVVSPTLLIVTPASLGSKRHTARVSAGGAAPGTFDRAGWQTIQTAQVGNTTLTNSGRGWNISMT